jgi:hypothetical protein
MIRVVLRVGVLEGLSGCGLGPWLIREVVSVRVWVWDAPMRLMTMGMMSTRAPVMCERSALAREV